MSHYAHYAGKNVSVTGGASFIGSTLVEHLVEAGATVQVIDDFSTGRLENLEQVAANISLVNGDLVNASVASKAFSDFQPDIVFHLAAIHGGRGFIEKYGDRILSNVVLDQNVFRAAVACGASMIVHASSACAYPIGLQENTGDRNYLSEDQAGFDLPGQAFPDGAYGWVKLFGEFQLQTIVSGTNSRGRSARIFTAYGERENESHAAVALVAKSLLGYNPFPIWGNGEQTRNFTYVKDTVKGLLLIGSDLRDESFDVINVGSRQHITVNDFVQSIFNEVGGVAPKLQHELHRPVGVASRASDNTKIKELFGWEPEIGIEVGIANLVRWYRQWESRALTQEELDSRLV